MHRNAWPRRIHRWLGIVFTITVIVSFIAIAQGNPPLWVLYLPLPPLGVQLFTGLYLFVLPYLKERGRRGVQQPS